MISRSGILGPAVAAALSALVGIANAADDVKIGVLMPLSGQLADHAAKLRRHAEFAADQINAAGGIKSLGGAKIKLVFADTRGVPESGQSEAERLILQDKVDVLTGAYNSSVTLPATVVAEKYKKPFLVFSAVSEEITNRGLKYTFRPNETTRGMTDTIFGFLDEQSGRTGKAPKSYAMVFENTDFGRDISQKFAEEAGKRGWKQAAAISYEEGLTDGTPIALSLGSANADLVATFDVHPDGLVLYRAMKDQAVKPPLMLDYADSSQSEFDPVLADFPGLLIVSSWHPAIAASRPFLIPYIDAYQKAYGEAPLPEGLQAFSDVYLLADVMERAASHEPEKIRAALASTNLDASSGNPALILPYERITFNEKGQNPAAGLMVLQSSDGKRVPVYPPSVVPSGYTVSWF